MTILTRLERKIGFLTIERLPLYVVTAQAVLYFWSILNPGSKSLFWLDPYSIIYKLEIWRLITGLFIIPVSSSGGFDVIMAFFYLYLLYIYGTALETEWGSFPFTLFYLVGVLGTYIACFLFGSMSGAFFLNITVFLAFAAIHPDFTLLLFFILPVKIKWLALLAWIWLGFLLLTMPWPVKAAIVFSLLNYLLFFGKTHIDQVKLAYERYQHRRRFRNF